MTASYHHKALFAMVMQLRSLASTLPDGAKEKLLSIVEHMEDTSADIDRSAAELYFRQAVKQSPQDSTADRNSWQRRLGALVTLIEAECIRADEACERLDPAPLLAAAYRVVNTNPMTDSIDDPYADIAKLMTRQTLEACLAAGLISPGPNAPDWMTQEEGSEEEPR